MRLSSLVPEVTALVLAAGLSVVAAGYAVTAVERGTEIAVRAALDDERQDWAEVQADGLQVRLSGEAETEALRFHALSVVGGVVDAARIINETTVTPAEALSAPRFSAEILRNDSGISIIGLVPSATDRDDLVAQLAQIAGDKPVSDLLQTASFPAPDGWSDALGFAGNALAKLPRSKISVEAGRVRIVAITDSAEEREALEASLQRAAPPGLRLGLAISAPRPVITPFTLRFVIDDNGPHFDACSADTEEAKSVILTTAMDVGLTGPGLCTVGMGVPTPRWSDAVEAAIRAVGRLGEGSVTFSNADVTLVAAEGTRQGKFDRVVGDLEAALPAVFALHAVLPIAPTDDEKGPPEFTATLSPEGLVQLRGRVTDTALRDMAESLAQARFGTDHVYMAARVVPDLPTDWAVRVLAGLEALSKLVNGAVIVTPDRISVRGTSSYEDAPAQVASLLSEKLGDAEDYALEIAYVPPPPPKDQPLDDAACETQISDVLALGKIQFEPGAATVDPSSLETMDMIAEILSQCGDIRLEIQGHTDSQGREEMNQQLSQARAQSVLNELRLRRVLTSNFAAVGYGEADPIADNGTEAGREANRRIEFVVIRPETIEDNASALDEIAGEAAPETEEDQNE